MEYHVYPNIHELCEILSFGSDFIHELSDYIVNGQDYAPKSSTMNTIKLFISWLLTRTKGNTFQVSSQYFLSLTYQDFNKFRQENMSRMTKVPTTQTPSTTKPFLSHPSGNPIILTYLVNLFVNLLKKTDELKSSPSSLFESSSNPFELPRPTKTSIPNQLWEVFCLKNMKITIEDPKKVKVVNPNPHSTIGNPEAKPTFVLDTPNPQSQSVHTPDICPSPNDPPQDVDKSHLSEYTSATTNLNERCSLDTSCDHLLHLDSPSLSSELQGTSSVESVEIEFVPDFEEPLENIRFQMRT